MVFWGKPKKERAGRQEDIDFDQAAHELFAQLGLSGNDIDRRSNYNPLDPIWKHPQNGAMIYIGNSQAAQSIDILKAHNIKRVVNCTDNMPNFLMGKEDIKYLRFDVSNWSRYIDHTNASVRKFTSPLFSFVTEGLEKGEGVMVHCLAGAHRAGTTGCACLMHFAKMDMITAVRAAKKCRPVVDPIGMLPEFLRRLEKMQATAGTPARSSGRAIGSAQAVEPTRAS